MKINEQISKSTISETEHSSVADDIESTSSPINPGWPSAVPGTRIDLPFQPWTAFGIRRLYESLKCNAETTPGIKALAPGVSLSYNVELSMVSVKAKAYFPR